jgi:hypothetical protein
LVHRSAEKDGPREVKQLSKDNELLRRLSYAANDPQPQSIEASSGEEKIFLIERNDQVERLRALALLQTTKESPNESVSDWKTVFEKKIVAHKNFGLEDGKPVANPTKPQSTRKRSRRSYDPIRCKTTSRAKSTWRSGSITMEVFSRPRTAFRCARSATRRT